MAIIGTDIKEAARLLRAGELVAIPTETVYGLAANAFSETAVLKIFEAKERPAFDPLIVHTHSVEQFSQIAVSNCCGNWNSPWRRPAPIPSGM